MSNATKALRERARLPARGLLCEFQLAVIVAMTAVRMVQVAIHEVIDVVVVRHRFMAAIRAVDVSGIVTRCRRGAAVRISGADFDNVFIDVIGVRMMQMPFVQVIDMTVVFHGRVAAAGAVVMIVMRMNFVVAHNNSLSARTCARYQLATSSFRSPRDVQALIDWLTHIRAQTNYGSEASAGPATVLINQWRFIHVLRIVS
jgi:hypothetical protein